MISSLQSPRQQVLRFWVLSCPPCAYQEQQELQQPQISCPALRCMRIARLVSRHCPWGLKEKIESIHRTMAPIASAASTLVAWHNAIECKNVFRRLRDSG